MAALSLPIFFPTGSPLWLIVNLSWDIFLGIGAFILLVYLVPRFQRLARTFEYPDKKGMIRYRPVHPKIFTAYIWLAVITLVVVLWGIFLTLVFSIGWVNPLSWNGLWFDLIYARANGEPNGAHIFSWLSCAGFGVVVWFKSIPRPIQSFKDVIGDPFQGIAALVFIGGIHELIWLPFYYTAYGQYLDWSLTFEVLRDVSFAVMMILFVLTFVKIPSRTFPLQKLKPIIIAYTAYLVLWYVIPYFVVGHLFPITTLNNPKFGVGLYEETPWFGLWWVNAIESVSWLLLCIPSAIKVWLYKKPAIPI